MPPTETVETKLPYPKGVFFILGFKLFERVFMQGIRSMLVLYLTSQIGFSEKVSTMVFHCHSAIIYLMGILGAVIADSWLGNYRTVLYMNTFALISMVVFVLYAAPQIGLPFRAAMTVLSLVAICAFNGSLKPCAAALGAEQFTLPDHKEFLQHYFAKFYFTVKVSSVVGAIVLPILRSDIPSISPSDGYLLSFGVGYCFSVLSSVVFVIGMPFYKKVQSSGNILIKMAKCILSAIVLKCKKGSQIELQHPHWLDYASSEFSRELVNDTKVFLNIVILFLPIPMLWALNEQTASVFPLQAIQMNGHIGFYIVKPDELQLLMQILILLFVPALQFVLYPTMDKLGIGTPLQKISLAGILSVLAFVIAGVLEVFIQQHEKFSIHLAWIIPQFAMLAAAEAIVEVTGLLFANMYAPGSLKTVMMALWLSTHALGNVINVIVFSMGTFNNKAILFFIFAGLMFLDLIIFIVIVKRYEEFSKDRKESLA